MKRNGTSHSGNLAIPSLDATLARSNGNALIADADQPQESTTHHLGLNLTNSLLPTNATSRSSRTRQSGYRVNTSIAQRLVAANVAIEAVLSDSVLQDRMAAYGYDQTHMLEGRALRDRALALHQQRHALSGAQLDATDARDAARKQAHAVYMRHVATARVLLRGQRGSMQKLDLGRRKFARADWLVQAKQFYTNALDDENVVARLAQFNLSREQLLVGQRLVDAVEAEDVVQKKRQGAAQEATQVRDAALATLHSWMRDFLAMARIALADQPQQLEKLSIVIARS